jgi:hypothetical protein
METEQDKLVDREPWRSLLAGSAEEPSALTDARIRAAARRKLQPRMQRWWLPASLAASLLLAVLIVQSQFPEPRAPSIVTESDVAAPAAVTPYSRQDAPAPSSDVEPAAPYTAPQRVSPPSVELPQIEVPAARIGLPPEQDGESARESSTVDSRQQSLDGAFAAPPAGVTAAPEEMRTERATKQLGDLQKSAAPARSPEKWYADIEKLRAAGEYEEANRELEKLKAVHPGWLEKNHPQDR